MALSGAFIQLGNTVTFTAATTAPTPVKVPTWNGFGVSQYEVFNPSNVTVFIGYGPAAANATANAVVVSSTSPAYPLLPGTDKIISAGPNAYFTGITAAGSATIYVTPGDGM